MKTILFLASLAIALPCFAAAPPPLPTLPKGFKPKASTNTAPARTNAPVDPAKLFSPGRATVTILSNAVVRRTFKAKTAAYAPSDSRWRLIKSFLPAADENLRPLRYVRHDDGMGNTSICVETIQQAGENITAEYTMDFITWYLFGGGFSPPPQIDTNVGICNTLMVSDLPPLLFVRVTSDMTPPTARPVTQPK